MKIRELASFLTSRGALLKVKGKLHGAYGVTDVTDVMQLKRRKWFGHLERTDKHNWVSACRNELLHSVQEEDKMIWE